MKAKALLFAVALAAAPALAAAQGATDNCAAAMAAIDNALPNVKQRTAAEMNEIKRLRMEGEKLHSGGKHPESLATLGKAKAMLKIK